MRSTSATSSATSGAWSTCPNLWAYTRELYQVPGVAETVNLHHIKQHYYGSHESGNPSGIVPAGPEIDFTAAHGRACPEEAICVRETAPYYRPLG